MKNEEYILNVYEIREFSKTQPEHIAMLLLFSSDALELSHRFPTFDSMMLYSDNVNILHYNPQGDDFSLEGKVVDKNGCIADWAIISEVWDDAWKRRMRKLSPQNKKNWKEIFKNKSLFCVSKGLVGDSGGSFEDSLLLFWNEVAGPRLNIMLQEFHLHKIASNINPSPTKAKI